jgi:hypothetical protein
MKKTIFKIISGISFFLIVLNSPVFSQSTTKVKGTVKDANSKEPIPFANVSFVGTGVGTVTDFEGIFFMETCLKADSVQFTCIGYKTQTAAIKRGSFRDLEILMKPTDTELGVVVVHAGVDPVVTLMKKVIRNRKKNNPVKFTSYSYEQYNKMELDVNNFNTKLENRKAMQQFKFIFDNVDTATASGKVFLPVLISETLSDYYFRRSPKKEKEIIKAVQVSGVKNESFNQFTGQMYLDVNIYDSYIQILDKQFVSPIAVNGLLVYDYYLTDSAFIDKSWCYQLTYKPRRKQEYTFKGDMWIADTTFAVKKMSARIAQGVNINFVKDLFFVEEFEKIQDSLWFPTKETVSVDFNLSNITAGFFGNKTTTRKNVKLDVQYPDNFFNATIPQELVVLPDASQKDTAYWSKNRHEELTVKEKKIYGMVDAIQKIPVFRTMNDIVSMLTLGYYKIGKFEYGPYFKTYSYNAIEGNRFRIGGRTSNSFSTKMEFNGHLAYGLSDQRFKYGIGYRYKLSKIPWCIASIDYSSDMTQLGLSPNAFTEDNIMSTLFSRSSNDQMLLQNKLDMQIEREWFKGFMNHAILTQKNIFPSGPIPFIKYDGTVKNQLNVSEASLGVHLAVNEKYLDGEFTRVYLGSKYPVLDITYSYGIKGVFNSDYQYSKLQLNLEHYFFIGPLGKMYYGAEAGKIWGRVPFPLLKLHEGNETYVFDYYSFNMMNFYEFASDQWFSAFFEHHFQGLFLNKIPVVRKLKFREILYGKGLIGSLDPQNRDEFAFPGTLSDVSKPYFEAGVGLENILKFIRIDAIWRLSHLSDPGIQKFGLRISLQVIL